MPSSTLYSRISSEDVMKEAAAMWAKAEGVDKKIKKYERTIARMVRNRPRAVRRHNSDIPHAFIGRMH